MVKSGALRKRYILFTYEGKPIDETAFKHALYKEALKFFGEFGLSEAALKLIRFDGKAGIIRCERDYLDKMSGFLALVSSLDGSEARLRPFKSSGTLKGLESTLDSIHPK